MVRLGVSAHLKVQAGAFACKLPWLVFNETYRVDSLVSTLKAARSVLPAICAVECVLLAPAGGAAPIRYKH